MATGNNHDLHQTAMNFTDSEMAAVKQKAKQERSSRGVYAIC
jgi:hypothetical protein